MKLASAVVCAQDSLPHPPDTQDFCHEIEPAPGPSLR